MMNKDKIEYRVGDATQHLEIDPKNVVIAHICNNQRKWGKGFVCSISKKWPKVRGEYLRSEQTLGKVYRYLVDVMSNGYSLWVFNMIAQNGIKSKNNPTPLDYKALEKCLMYIKGSLLPEYNIIVMPKIGTGLGGGDWSVISAMINDILCNNGFKVIVYKLHD